MSERKKQAIIITTGRQNQKGAYKTVLWEENLKQVTDFVSLMTSGNLF